MAIYGEEPKVELDKNGSNLLVSKASVAKGGYLIRTIAPAMRSLPLIFTYLANLVDLILFEELMVEFTIIDLHHETNLVRPSQDLFSRSNLIMDLHEI